MVSVAGVVAVSVGVIIPKLPFTIVIIPAEVIVKFHAQRYVTTLWLGIQVSLRFCGGDLLRPHNNGCLAQILVILDAQVVIATEQPSFAADFTPGALAQSSITRALST